MFNRYRPVVTALLVGLTGVVQAQSAPNLESDQMFIVDPAGVLHQYAIPEGNAAATEPAALYNIPAGFPGAPSLDPIVYPKILPGSMSAVVLLEPPSEPIDPNEPPPVYWNPNERVSELVMMFQIGGIAGPSVAFISDGDPYLASWVKVLQGNNIPTTRLEETGKLQDMTPFLVGAAAAGYKIGVISDVSAVPEPSAATLALIGVVGMMGAWLRVDRATRR